MCHPAFDGRDERVDFIGGAFDDTFNASVGAVADSARYVKIAGGAIGGEPEADALYLADKSNNPLFCGHCTGPHESTLIVKD